MHSGPDVEDNNPTEQDFEQSEQKVHQDTEESGTDQQQSEINIAKGIEEGGTSDSEHKAENMMMSSQSTRVQTDAEGLILPKKLINPCLESTDRKELHRELKFNNKIGKSVLNQKSELQRAYDKQKERQQQNHQQEQHSPTTVDLKGELNRAIMERAQKHDNSRQQDASAQDDDKQYVNPEYLNVRAKLRTGQQRPELK